jgi:N-acyl homoserine lactone hydrolase
MSSAQVPFPLAESSSDACVEVELLQFGESLAPPGWFFRVEAEGSWRKALGMGVPKSSYLRSPNGAFLVRHPSFGPFLIDSGLHSLAATNLRQDFGRINARIFATLKMDPAEGIAEQLRGRGVEAGAVELVVMTHLHVDHTSGMRALGRATFLCTEREWAAANRRLAVLNGYVTKHFPEPSRIKRLDFSTGVAHGPFSCTLDLFGDGSVRLISTPGHTDGHMSALVRLTNGEALIAGDAIYTLRNLRDSLISWKTANDELYRSSLRELRAFAEQNPSTPIIPTHDAGVWDDLKELR